MSPSDYSWVSFALSVAIGGTVVFLCLASVVIVRALHFRSRQFKRDSGKESEERKNSVGTLETHSRQLESVKEGIQGDDKDPDIIPCNIGLPKTKTFEIQFKVLGERGRESL